MQRLCDWVNRRSIILYLHLLAVVGVVVFCLVVVVVNYRSLCYCVCCCCYCHRCRHLRPRRSCLKKNQTSPFPRQSNQLIDSLFSLQLTPDYIARLKETAVVTYQAV